jgi:hypothetical protein
MRLALSIDEQMDYDYFPESQDGVNSNSAAGRVAMIDGGDPYVGSARTQPGSREAGRVGANGQCPAY